MYPPPPALCLFLTLLYTVSFLKTAFAQVPILVLDTIGVTVEGRTFFVAGGTNGTTVTDQFVALDLTVSWPTSNPQWTMLPSLPLDVRFIPLQGGLIKGGSELFITSRGRARATYSLATKSWSSVSNLPNEYCSSHGLMAITDPGTDRIVVPSGYISAGWSYGTLIYSWGINTTTSAPGMETADPSGGTPVNIMYYAATWSTERKSVLVYGGRGNNTYNTKLLEFVPSTGKWSIVETKGDGPGAREGACLVPGYKGKSMVLFGGYAKPLVLTSIYTLDLTSLTWTKGTDIDPTSGRVNHVCTTAGDNFVAWGGSTTNGSVPPAFAEPVVYDMRNRQWTNMFALDTSNTPGPSVLDKSNLGAIAGGVVGVLVVVIAVGFFFYSRHRAKGGASSGKSKDESLPKGPTCTAAENAKETEERAPPVPTRPTKSPQSTYAPVATYDPAIPPLNPHTDPIQPELRNPQWRGLTWGIDHHGTNPQEFPVEPYTDRVYSPPAPQELSPSQSSSVSQQLSSTVVPVSPYQDNTYFPPPPLMTTTSAQALPSSYAVSSSNYHSLAGDTTHGFINTPTTAGRENNGPGSQKQGNAQQRLMKEMLQEQERMRQLEIELAIQKSRVNMKRLEVEIEGSQA